MKKRSFFLALAVLGSSLTVGMIHAQEAVIYMDSTHQVIQGFGAANILPWRPDMTAGEIEKAFGTGDGQIGFSLLRLRIPPETWDFSRNVSTALAAHARGVKIIASPWSPPASMKTNGDTEHGGRLFDSCYADYAAHLKSFVDHMASNSVPIYAVSVQNEPDVSVDYESCDWNASEMLKFMKENAPSVGTRVFAPESYHFDRSLSDPILNDSTAASHTAFIGGHIYGGGLYSYPLAESKGKEVWMTEHLSGERNFTNDWSWSMQVATEMNACLNAGMSAYIWWYIVRYYGPISDGQYDAYGVKGTVTKKGYVMSQFARFIRPGFVRVHATYNPQAQIYVTAYKSDTDLIIVAVNTSSSSTSQRFNIPNLAGGAAAFTPYVTSATVNCQQGGTIPLTTGTFTTSLESSSITTFVATDFITGTVEGGVVPQTITLSQNHPNPFNPATSIAYSISQSDFVSLKIYDLLGREIQTLVQGYRTAGNYTVTFHPDQLASGVYVYRLQTGNNNSLTRKMLLLR
ncbi:MAG: T9SS type A sorting domain-containing protein [Fidelibacterota bacterium]|nr:MAG: T9SS type A sorting domain-containing protein [Candidatus Neomarinimicrobiota bacterium]